MEKLEKRPYNKTTEKKIEDDSSLILFFSKTFFIVPMKND